MFLVNWAVFWVVLAIIWYWLFKLTVFGLKSHFLETQFKQKWVLSGVQLAQTWGDVYETEAYHHWCLVTVTVLKDQINALVSSPQAFIWHSKIFSLFRNSFFRLNFNQCLSVRFLCFTRNFLDPSCNWSKPDLFLPVHTFTHD